MLADARGNLLFTEWPGSGIRLVNNGTEAVAGVLPGQVGVVAGGRFGCRAGPAATAELGNPMGLAADAEGNVYIADAACRVVWRMDASYTRISLVAGQPGVSDHVDGTGTAARFRYPRGVTVGPDGQLYVTDYVAHVVRRVTRDGEVTTVAGNPGNIGHVDGVGSDARFASPAGLVMDGQGDIYVGDWDSASLRRLSPGEGADFHVESVISAEAGTVTCGRTAWSRPEGSQAPGGRPSYVTMGLVGDKPIVPFWDNGVWQIGPPAGAEQGWTFSQLLEDRGVMAVAAGEQRLWTGGWIYGAASHNTLHQYDLGNLARGHLLSVGIPGELSVQDGEADVATFNFSGIGGDLALDQEGNIWVADASADRVRRISPDGAVVSVGSGQHGAAGGQASTAQFCTPVSITAVGSEVFVVNRHCGANVMRIDTSDNSVEVRGTICPASAPRCPLPAVGGGIVADAAGNLFLTTSYASGAGALEQYGNSCFDGMALIVKVGDWGRGEATVFAGTPNNPADPENRYQCVDGAPGAGQFGGSSGGPLGLAIDASGTLYVADTSCGVRKVDSEGNISTITADLNAVGIALDTTRERSRLYAADADHTIRAVDLESGALSLLAGAAASYEEHFADGPVGRALFWRPRALAVDAQGRVVVLDQNNDRVRRVDPL